jgi:hypothetical protein
MIAFLSVTRLRHNDQTLRRTDSRLTFPIYHRRLCTALPLPIHYASFRNADSFCPIYNGSGICSAITLIWNTGISAFGTSDAIRSMVPWSYPNFGQTPISAIIPHSAAPVRELRGRVYNAIQFIGETVHIINHLGIFRIADPRSVVNQCAETDKIALVDRIVSQWPPHCAWIQFLRCIHRRAVSDKQRRCFFQCCFLVSMVFIPISD